MSKRISIFFFYEHSNAVCFRGWIYDNRKMKFCVTSYLVNNLFFTSLSNFSLINKIYFILKINKIYGDSESN